MVTAFLFWGKVIDRRGALDWRGFLVGRLWRLYPAYLVVFAAILLAVAASSGFTGGCRWASWPAPSGPG